MDTADALSIVEDARARGDYAAALSAALGVWAVTRAPVVAQAVDALDREARRTFAAPEVRTNAELQKRWLALAGANDPVAAGWLAESLFDKLPGRDGDEKLDAFCARLQAARSHPDPRMARALMTLVEQAAPIVRWAAEECRKTLALIGDGRTGASIDALMPSLDKSGARSWRSVRDELPKGKPIGKADDKRWRSLGGGAPKAGGAPTAADREALFEAVLDAPDDDQARAVLADALQEIEDPRGEFIAIQLAEAEGRATPEASKRADALLQKHKKAWLGPFARVTYRATFRRGLLAELELDGTWKATAKAWADLSDHRLLATVERIHGKATPDIMVFFVTSPEMRSLRDVTIESDAVADAIERNPPKLLRTVRSTGWKRHAHPDRFAECILPLALRTPSIDSIVCTMDTIELLMKSKALARMRAVEVVAVDYELAVDLWARMPKSIKSFTFGWSSRSELRRDDKGRVSVRVELRGKPSPLPDLVEHAGKIAKLAHVEIEGPKKQLDASVVDALKKKGLAVDVLEPVFRSGLAGGMGG